MEATPETTKQDNVKEMPKKHGFTFSYKAFEKIDLFVMAFRKVYTCPDYGNFKSAHRIKRLGDAIQTEINTYMDLRKKIKDDDEEREKKLEDLHSIEVELKWDRLSEDEISCVKGISPSDLVALEHIIDPSALN